MKILIIIFLFLCVTLYSQSWNTIDTTSVPIHNSSGEKIALFANHYGIHLLKIGYTPTGSPHVRYYKLKTNGDVEKDTLLDSSGDFPNITGDENILYAVYRKADTIKTRYSTDGGNNWLSRPAINFTNGNVNCNGVDAAYTTFRGLHVVWSEKVGNKYESYFNRFISNNWTGSVPITNTSPVDSGGFPTVTTSSVSGVDKAHVSIRTDTASAIGNSAGKTYSRDFNYSTWTNPVAILSYANSRMDKLIAVGSYIHFFYYTTDSPLPKLKYKRKTLASSVWTDSSEINSSVSMPNHLHEVNITKSNGDTLHIIWHDAGGGLYHSKKHNTSNSWSSQFEVGGGVSQWDCAIANVSNDLFVIWTQVNLNYRYRQYDANPLTPPDFAGENYNNFPKVTWTKIEPDVEYFEVWRQIVTDINNPGGLDITYNNFKHEPCGWWNLAWWSASGNSLL